MFPTVYVNKDFINSKNWLVQLATLFRVNENSQIKSQMNKLTFSNLEIDAIIFLKSILDLKPENVFELSKKRDSVGLDKKTILEFSKLNRLDLRMIKAFMKYKPSTNGRDVMKQFDVKGAEIADKIREIEAEKFSKLI